MSEASGEGPSGDDTGVGEGGVDDEMTSVEEADVVGEEPAPLLDLAVIEAAPLDGPPPLTYLELSEERRRRRYLLGGVAVTSLGLGLFVVIATGLSFWGTLFLVPAVLLLVLAAAWRPFYWLYLPGFALLGLGLGWIVDSALTPEPDVWLSWIALGAGLLVAYVIRRLQGRHAHWLAPAGGATAIAVGLLAGVDDPWQIVWKGWPLVLVAIGLALVTRALLMGRRKRGRGGPPAVR